MSTDAPKNKKQAMEIIIKSRFSKDIHHSINSNHITGVKFREKNWLPIRAITLSKVTDDNKVVTVKDCW